MPDMLKGIKDYLYYISIGVAVLGILGTIVIMALSYYVVDTIQNEAKEQLELTKAAITELEKAMEDTVTEISNAQDTTTEIETTLDELGDSVDSLGQNVREFGEILGDINLGIINFQEESQSMMQTALLLKTSSESLSNINLNEHKISINELKEDLSGLKNEITKQKQDLVEAKKISDDVFNNIKVIVVIFGFLEIMLFGVILLNSVAGLGN